MSWDNAQALHVFAPPREPYGANWVEQILGDVVRPILARYADSISWVWMTRYADVYVDSQPPLDVALPAEFRADGRFRFLVLRLQINPDDRGAVQTEIIQLARAAGCFTDPRDWIAYDPVADVGGDRFIRNDAAEPERAERARLVLQFVDATVRLMLHSLVKDPAEHWINEPNMIRAQNPKGSMFESIRHLFCNATGVPTSVLVAGDWRSLQLGTYWMSPVSITGEAPREYTHEIMINY